MIDENYYYEFKYYDDTDGIHKERSVKMDAGMTAGVMRKELRYFLRSCSWCDSVIDKIIVPEDE